VELRKKWEMFLLGELVINISIHFLQKVDEKRELKINFYGINILTILLISLSKIPLFRVHLNGIIIGIVLFVWVFLISINFL
jgi:hypothetical protein